MGQIVQGLFRWLDGLGSVVHELGVEDASVLFQLDGFEQVFGSLLQKHVVVSFPCRVYIIVVVVPAQAAEGRVAMPTQHFSALGNDGVGQPAALGLQHCRDCMEFRDYLLGGVGKILTVLNVEPIDFHSCEVAHDVRG